MNPLLRTEHANRPDTPRALHAAALMAVRESRRAKAEGDRRRASAWLRFAEACTEMYLVERRLP